MKKDPMGIAKKYRQWSAYTVGTIWPWSKLFAIGRFLCMKWLFCLTKLSLWNYWTISPCACFVPVFIILCRSCNKVLFRVTGHILESNILSFGKELYAFSTRKCNILAFTKNLNLYCLYIDLYIYFIVTRLINGFFCLVSDISTYYLLLLYFCQKAFYFWLLIYSCTLEC